ncbi:MAG: VWA domain-containing protein [Deltaproteobacteria bacterium]|nr:VWA domain-containing protein [Deltaproteobacteria bacterium]
MSDGDRLSIVAFNSETEVLLESSVLDADVRARARQAIDGLEARGTTDMAGGLSAGLQQVLAHRSDDAINRLVLLGDGIPNDASAIPNLARSAGGRGIAISALGLGLDYDEALMGDVAQLSGGHFHYLESSEAVASVFRDEVVRLERVVARNASLVLQPGPGVIISSVVGQQTPGGRSTLSIALGDIAEGESKDVVVRLRVPAKREGSAVELLDARLSFIDAVDDAGSLRRDVFLGADATASEEQLASGQNQDVMNAAEQASAAAATIQAIRVVRAGHLAEARRMLEETQRRMSKNTGSANRAYTSSVAAFVEELEDAEATDADRAPTLESGEPAPAPPRMERRLREAHEASMDVLGY